MAILNIVPFQPAGAVGVEPYWISILTSDTVATVTTTGYLTQAAQAFGYTFSDKQMALVYTSNAKNQLLQVTVTATGVVSLVAPDVSVDDLIVDTLEIVAPTPAKGNILFVATDNTGDTTTTITNAEFGQTSTLTIPDPGAATANFILSEGATDPQVINTGLSLTGASSNLQTTGGGDILAGASAAAGSVFSYPVTATSGRLELRGVDSAGDFTVTIANASHAQSTVVSIPDAGAATADFILSATAAGTQSIGTGISIVGANNVQTTGGGNFIAGASGTDGFFVSFPATATSGTLNLAAATNATGDFDTTISNATAVAQDQVISIPDVGAATGEFLVKSAALVSGNLISATGTAGKTEDSGIAAASVQSSTNIIAATSGNIGGAGAGPLNVVVAGLTAASVVVATIESSSNPASVIACTAGTGSFDITLSADPGATCLVNYIAFIAAQ